MWCQWASGGPGSQILKLSRATSGISAACVCLGCCPCKLSSHWPSVAHLPASGGWIGVAQCSARLGPQVLPLQHACWELSPARMSDSSQRRWPSLGRHPGGSHTLCSRSCLPACWSRPWLACAVQTTHSSAESLSLIDRFSLALWFLLLSG